MKDWPALHVEKRPIESLIPYARNARTHSDAQVAQIAASIKEWGWTTPVIIGEDGGIIAGHGRVLAARQLGINQVPVAIASGWTDAQKRAYVLADNKLALNAGWDEEILKAELDELEAEGFDIDLTGFTGKEILELEPVPDVSESDNEAPEVKPDSISQLGEIYELGEHFLMCGDSTNPEDVVRLMDGKLADMLFTDPPYGVNYEGGHFHSGNVDIVRKRES